MIVCTPEAARLSLAELERRRLQVRRDDRARLRVYVLWAALTAIVLPAADVLPGAQRWQFFGALATVAVLVTIVLVRDVPVSTAGGRRGVVAVMLVWAGWCAMVLLLAVAVADRVDRPLTLVGALATVPPMVAAVLQVRP
jgi:hypothetical protein